MVFICFYSEFVLCISDRESTRFCDLSLIGIGLCLAAVSS